MGVLMRITREDAGDSDVMLRIEGSVVGEWVALLENECVDLLLSSHAVSIDLTEVVFVDQAGVMALGALGREGVRIYGRPGAVASVLEGEGIRVMQDEGDEPP